jgi:hypothetical protein
MKTARLSLREIKSRHKGYFFSRATMKAFRGYKMKTQYNKDTKDNFVVTTSPSGRKAIYQFNKRNGKLIYVAGS